MLFVSVFLSFIGVATASRFAQNLVLHEKMDAIPEGFVQNGPAAESTTLNLRINLASTDITGLQEALFAVSTPHSARYGQHLTKEEVEAFVAPKSETIQVIKSFLRANGLTSKTISPAGDWLRVLMSVSKANELFGAQFSVFTNQASGQQTIRTMQYSIPTSLKGHVELIHPTVTFPTTFGQPRFTSPGIQVPLKDIFLVGNVVPASCATSVTPACLQALYGIPTARATQHSNTLGVSGFTGQFAQSADLQTFLRAQRPDLVNTTFALQTLDGGVNTQGAGSAGIEANLDIQYTVGVASGVPTTFISVGNDFQDGALDGFLDIINFLLAEAAPPQVLTTSYGQNENTISRALANQLCNAYMQLGARGTSILFSSGDGGVAGSQSESCTAFLPTFPSGCPFVTSVGATTGIGPETAASFTSGGFSNFFARPSYQSAVVSSFLTRLGSTNSGKFNTSGRGFPDVSAQGENIVIVNAGKTGSVSGTSCASPVFASVVSLLNDQLIAAGKSPLGFLNPFLYSAAGIGALTDITTGNNPGCNTNGFAAGIGWDPVTGLGTPNFPKLLTAVVSLGSCISRQLPTSPFLIQRS
ncbi:hypothetical protein M422DRAFT_189249 [Sphaerobolus stellatus SS14]|uniref:tripeptidyl-peptidase II n=1 Tax=Sphaerobolus stellatus (strain SS14) TaxID=990650 RepID=A0A0C9TH55_SPHS4|nr:hypothetical protein M422DRAFT_189249 [Sphaerobolus stellatus SS14]